MALPEDRQRTWKRQLVVDALRRIGKLDADALVAETRSPGPPLGYRNRVEFTLRERSIGLWGRDEHGERALVDIDACRLQSAEANALLATLRARGGEFGAGRRLVVRSAADGSLLVGLWETGAPLPDAASLAEALMAAHPALRGVVRIRATSGRRGGTRVETLAGEGRLCDRIGEIDLDLPAVSFAQVNRAGAECLIELVRAACGDVRGALVWDLFGGVGLFGLHLARDGARRVVVCEADPEAVAAGRRAARRARLGAMRYRRSDVRAFLSAVSRETPDRVVANPPRRGFESGVAHGLVRAAPERIVVVSCDPATLARDLRVPLDAGYVVRQVVPVDLFPQTAHVETVVRLDRDG